MLNLISIYLFEFTLSLFGHFFFEVILNYEFWLNELMVIPMYERTKERSLTGNKAVATAYLFGAQRTSVS